MDQRVGVTARNIVVGVTGGIAAYKACIVVRRFKEAGHDVTVVPTRSALNMVGKATWEALSGKPVYTDVFEATNEVTHVRYGQQADAVVVVPATANTMAKVRSGIADNLLTSTLLTATCPVFLAPAMHTEMWNNPATMENVQVLRNRGFDVIEPAVGRLTGKDSGAGRLPEPDAIVAHVLEALNATSAETEALSKNRGSSVVRDLEGLRVLISAGGTREPIDPVRFVGNYSSGRFGARIAAAAAARGGDVVLVEANLAGDVQGIAGNARIVHAPSALSMHAAMAQEAEEADVIIMAAAVADFRPTHVAESKQKKTGESRRTIELIENPDILADLAKNRRKSGQTVIGFAAETGDSSGSVEEYGKAKAARKGADLVVINRVGEGVGFGDVTTEVLVVDASGQTRAAGRGSKEELADVILDAVIDVRRA